MTEPSRGEQIAELAERLQCDLSRAEFVFALEHGEITPTGDVVELDDDGNEVRREPRTIFEDQD